MTGFGAVHAGVAPVDRPGAGVGNLLTHKGSSAKVLSAEEKKKRKERETISSEFHIEVRFSPPDIKIASSSRASYISSQSFQAGPSLVSIPQISLLFVYFANTSVQILIELPPDIVRSCR